MLSKATDAGKTKRGPWLVVRGWPSPRAGFYGGLDPGAKLVWHYLHEVAGGTERSAVVRVASIAAALGMSDPRAARRALGALLKVGLASMPDRFDGEIMVYLHDPWKAARARLMPAGSDGQGDLFPEGPQSLPEVEEPSRAEVLALPPGVFPPVESADDARHPPFLQTPPGSPLAERHDDCFKLKALSSISLKREEQALSLDGGWRASSAASKAGECEHREAIARLKRLQDSTPPPRDTPDPPTLGQAVPPVAELIAARVAKIDIPGQAAKARQTADWLLSQLQPVPREFHTYVKGRCLLIAWAIVQGQIAESAVHQKLQDTREKAKTSPSGWFLRAMQALFADRGLPWSGGRSKQGGGNGPTE